MSDSKYIPLENIDKDFLLNESKVFCMFPWIHLNTTPKGDIYPCCSNDYTKPMGNTADMTLKEAFNTDYMKNLRSNMLSEKKNDICTFCYNHEIGGPHSFRTYSIDNFAQHFDKVIGMTKEDGYVDEFKMHYYDIRFSNICNFKCRTCGTEFSSQWAIEDKKHWNPDGPIIIHVDNEKGDVLKEILDQIEHIELAYFAGGEPLITEEHYIILEEMIRKGKTNTVLRYNTNASTTSYKQYDLFKLWQHFDKIELSCSIDSWGERAEIMRHGTDWGKVETNLKMFRSLPYVDFQLNTVFSIMNYMTLGEFYTYMVDKELVDPFRDWGHSLYQLVNPLYYSARTLPKEMKQQAADSIDRHFNSSGFKKIIQMTTEAVKFAKSEDTWEQGKEDFFKRISDLDERRDEDFFSVFTELKPLMDTY